MSAILPLGPLPSIRAIAIAIAFPWVSPAAAQCTPTFLPGMPLPGVGAGSTAIVRAIVPWDRDGAGPLPPILAIAGTFTIAGSSQVTNIASYDPAARLWAPIGPLGGNGTVLALCALPNGDLVAGGSFTQIGGIAANALARWNGTAWTPMPGAFTSAIATVNALTRMPNGDLVVGGQFTGVGISNGGLARYDGMSWLPITPALPGSVTALLALPNGDLLVGHTNAPSTSTGNLVRYDGTTWSGIGTGLWGAIYTLAQDANGDLLVGGRQMTAGLAGNNLGLARWDGTIWRGAPNAAFQGHTIHSILPVPTGGFYACGTLQPFGGAPSGSIARWTGDRWRSVGSGIPADYGNEPHARALAYAANGDLVVGGKFTATGSGAAQRIASWNGSTWGSLGDGTTGETRARAWLPNGDLVVGGAFQHIGDSDAKYLARFDGVHWQALGTPFNGPVDALLTLPNGDLVAGGRFTHPGTYVARWNGTAWAAMPGLVVSPLSQGVSTLLALTNGDILASGRIDNGVARWNGSTWSNTGNAPQANFLLQRANGTVVAATNTGVQQWDGSTTWTAVGFSFQGNVLALAENGAGDLLAGGTFSQAGGAQATGIARWNGTLWWPIGNNTTYARSFVVQPDGDIVLLRSSPPALLRWNGTQWSQFASGSGASLTFLAQEENGDLLLGGDFYEFVGAIRTGLVRITTPCPATATAHGLGCTGSGGANVLVADNRPWLGATFRSTATGMPTNGLAIGLRGFGGTTQPLGVVLPAAAPGCWLYLSPDLVDAFVPTAGTLQWSWPLPNTPALAGSVVFQQILALDLAFGALGAATSTNRLTLTLGAL
jgi:hypothetical protein